MQPMEEIWQSVSVDGGGGTRVIRFKGTSDLGFLYVSGFVDVKQCNFQQWLDAFAASRQKDGSYVVSHDQWMEKKPLRYAGPVGKPFDLNTIEEREYAEEEFLKLLTEKLLPNTYFDPSYAPQILADLKVLKKTESGKIKIDAAFKKEIVDFIENHPSSMRVLEVMVEAIRNKKAFGAAAGQASAQSSRFSAGKTAEQIARARLEEMAGILKSQEVPPAVSDAPAVSIKEIRKKKPTGRI